jgi:short-subunit dehydrogenase
MTDTSTRPFAVVTGGSNGIGLELARQFLANGFDVLIAGEDDQHTPDAVRTLSAEDQGEVTSWSGDLGREDQVNAFYEAIRASGRPVDALCVNAGFGLGGAFVETDLARELQMIDVNVRGAVQLTKLVLKNMVGRNAGRILFTSSIAATMPDPFEAVYGSTKVFLRWFGEALRNELKDTGVTVTVLMPSVTDTNFFNRAEMVDTKAGASDNKDDPTVVAKAGFDALMAGDDKVVPTLKNKVMGAVADALPDKIAAQVHRGMSEPGSAG